MDLTWSTRKDKEWLEKHNVDMDVEKLKQFLTERDYKMWQILRDINDLIKEEPYREKIKMRTLIGLRGRGTRKVYRKMIHNYKESTINEYECSLRKTLQYDRVNGHR